MFQVTENQIDSWGVITLTIGDGLSQSHFNKEQLRKEDRLQPNSNARINV